MPSMIEINSLKFGIRCNFPHFCGEERTKEAIAILDQLEAEHQKMLKDLRWIKEQYETDFTDLELKTLNPRDKAIYQTVKDY